jgi:hypothetical protein
VARQGIALSGETLIANLAVGIDRSLYGAHVENRRKEVRADTGGWTSAAVQ